MNALQGTIRRIIAKTAPLSNIPYEIQLQMKERRCINSLKEFASILRKSNRCPQEFLADLDKFKGLPYKIDSIKASVIENGYRNRVGASVGFDINGEVAVGHVLQTKKNKRIIVSQLPDNLNKKKHVDIIKIFENFVKEHTAFLPDKNTLLTNWYGIMVRSNRQDDSMVHINFSTADESEDILNKAKQELLDRYLPMLAKKNIDIKSLYWLNHKSLSAPDDIFPSELLFGEKYITETLCDKIFYIAPRSFFQINTDIAELLYQNTRQLIIESFGGGVKRKRLILDLCCGTGTIGVILSDIAHKVISVDQVVSSVEVARLNAAKNNVSNIEHVCQDVEDFLVEFIRREEVSLYDDIIAIVNPSRNGLTTRFCEKLRQCKQLNMILYLSCQFEGQPSRNLYHLCKLSNSRNQGNPFRLTDVVPLDPFPHTKYVELILKLVR